jgi:hypothetical protein
MKALEFFTTRLISALGAIIPINRFDCAEKKKIYDNPPKKPHTPEETYC